MYTYRCIRCCLTMLAAMLLLVGCTHDAGTVAGKEDAPCQDDETCDSDLACEDSNGCEDPCDGISCSDHGACEVSDDQPSCRCDAGYHNEGLDCVEDEGSPCEGVTCSGRGTCSVRNGQAECICDEGYHPENLECVENPPSDSKDPEDPCRGITCSGHGTCVDNAGNAECDCDGGYYADGLTCVEDTADSSEYVGGTVNSSVMLFGEWDWNTDNCIRGVERAAELGTETVNFVPTHYFDGAQTSVDKFGKKRFVVSDYCYKSEGGCLSFDNTAIQNFEKGMRKCFEVAVDLGLNLAVIPHLDPAPGSSGGWRNNADFDPLEKLEGASYAEFMLYPLARAINDAMGLSTDVYFALQAEMGETLFLHPDSYKKLADEIQQMLLDGLQSSTGRVQVGISLNWNSVGGGVKPDDIADKTALVKLFERAEFIGLSAYHPVSAYPVVEDFDTSIDSFAGELETFGIDLWDLHQQGQFIHFSEFGIGGGANGKDGGKRKATTRPEAAEKPYMGVGGSCSTENDPWVGEVKDFRRDYYVAAVHHFTGHGIWQVDKTFLWNIGSWDVQGLSNETGTGECNYRDDFVVSLIEKHNRAVMSGEYLSNPDGIPVCDNPESDADGDGWGSQDGQQCAVVVPEPETEYVDGFPVCTDPNSDPDGDGWGWENGETCIVAD